MATIVKFFLLAVNRYAFLAVLSTYFLDSIITSFLFAIGLMIWSYPTIQQSCEVKKFCLTSAYALTSSMYTTRISEPT